MYKRRLVIIGIGALVVSALLTFFVYRTFVAKLASVRASTTQVVVASKDLPLGYMIAEGDIRTVSLPATDLPQGVMQDPAAVIGRGVIAPMVTNEIVLQSKLALDKAGAGLPAMIPPNKRAVSVQVNEVIAVAGFVAPGTRVDVLLTGSPTHQAANTDVMTTTVLENIEVLAAGQKIEPNAEGKPEKVPVITLLVSPDEAQKLTLASSEGKIHLALRNPLDATKVNTAPVHNVALYKAGVPETAKKVLPKKAAKPAPVPATYVYELEVIRGEKKEVTKF